MILHILKIDSDMAPHANTSWCGADVVNHHNYVTSKALIYFIQFTQEQGEVKLCDKCCDQVIGALNIHKLRS